MTCEVGTMLCRAYSVFKLIDTSNLFKIGGKNLWLKQTNKANLVSS